MTEHLKEIKPDYLAATHVIRPGDRLHRLIARLGDTYIDDLTDDLIIEIEKQVDIVRITHADGSRLDT